MFKKIRRVIIYVNRTSFNNNKVKERIYLRLLYCYWMMSDWHIMITLLLFLNIFYLSLIVCLLKNTWTRELCLFQIWSTIVHSHNLYISLPLLNHLVIPKVYTFFHFIVIEWCPIDIYDNSSTFLKHLLSLSDCLFI